MIIDAHSHIGIDYYFGDSKIKDYDNFCLKSNISKGMLMPMPWPVYNEKNIDICSLIWEHEDYKKINYYKVSYNKNYIEKESIFSNPYEKINYFYYNQIKNSELKTKIEFIPLVHGVLDNAYYIEKMINKMKPVAVKFHGFSGGFFPDNINSDLIEVIRYYDIPIILHTSVYKYNDGYGADTKYWRNKCSPKNWCLFLKENNLKGTLNHGACLDEEVINIVNKSDNIRIGIGPDFEISNDPYKVLTEKDTYVRIGYLNLLKKMTDPEKILFDVDYNWNSGINNELDSDSIYRIYKTWNYIDSEKILENNAKQFYKL